MFSKKQAETLHINFLYKKVLIIVQNENLQNETQWGAVRVKET
jgi:hypothetical protein